MKLKLPKSAYLPHQWKFMLSPKKIIALVAGFGSGKTHVFVRRTFKEHVLNKNPKNNMSFGWIIYPTYALAEELFIEPFLELLTLKGIRYKYNVSKKQIRTKHGYIRIYQLQKPARMVGSELTYIGFDEFDIESAKNCAIAYKKGLARMRGCDNPVMYFVTTPEGYHETYRIFVKDASDDKELIHARTVDNPHLPEGYVETLMEEYDPRMLEGYLNGKFVNLVQGSVYYSFDRKVHVPQAPVTYDPTLPVGLCVDFNVTPMCWELVQFRDANDIRVIGEIVQKNTNTWAMCLELKEKFPNSRQVDLVIYGDASGKSRDTRGTDTDYTIIDQELRPHFKSITYRVPMSNPPIRTRYAEVNARLSHNPLAKPHIKNTAIQIDHRCIWLIEDLEQVAYDANNTGNPDTSNKDRTHSSDGFGYFIHVEFPIMERRKPAVIKIK